MKKISSLACLLTALFCFNSNASELAVVGEVSYSMPSGDDAAAFTSAIGYGGGVIFSSPLSGSLGLDIGALFSIHRLSTDLGIISITSSVNTIQAPVKLQFMLGDSLALGAGGYVSYFLEASSISYGALGGLKLNLGQSAFIDVNYQYDLDGSGFYNAVKAYIGFKL